MNLAPIGRVVRRSVGIRRRWFVVVLLVVAASVVMPGPLQTSTASACSCEDPADKVAILAAEADATFVGSVVEIRPSESGRVSDAASRYVFDVDEVFAGGGVRARQSIVTSASGASCGLELSVGTPAIVFADREGFRITTDPGEFAANLCQVVPNPTAAVLAELGDGRPPDPGASPIGTDQHSSPTLLGYWAVVAAAAVCIGGATLLVRQRRRRRLSA